MRETCIFQKCSWRLAVLSRCLLLGAASLGGQVTVRPFRLFKGNETENHDMKQNVPAPRRGSETESREGGFCLGPRVSQGAFH